MAREYPGAQITAVSNSAPQIEHINSEAEKLGYRNLAAVFPFLCGIFWFQKR